MSTAPPRLAGAVLSSSFAKYGSGGPLVFKALEWATGELGEMANSDASREAVPWVIY